MARLREGSPEAQSAANIDRDFTSGRGSDHTITCNGTVFHVNKDILSSCSKRFAGACSNGSNQTQTRTIDFPEEHPRTINTVLRYLYGRDYGTGRFANRVLLHAMVYLFAEKYLLQALRREALKRYRNDIHVSTASHVFKSIRAMYLRLAFAQPLRDAALQFV